MNSAHEDAVFTRRAALKFLLGAGSLAFMPRIALGVSQEDIDAAQAELDAAQQQLEEIAAQYEALSEQQAQTLEEISTVQGQIEETQASIVREEQNLRNKQSRLSKRVSSAYKSGGTDLLSVVLSASSFEELFSNIYYLDKITESDRTMIDEVKAIKQRLSEQKAQLEEREADLEELSAQQEQQLAAMQAKQDEVKTLMDGLSQQVRDLIAQRDAELAAAAAEAERARAAAAAAAAAGSSVARVSPGALTQGTTGSQTAVINACYTTPTAGSGWCAAWVSNVFRNAGVGSFSGNACDMYNAYCYSSSRGELQPGMIVAVSTHPGTVAGRIYGHVGIYVGGGIVMQNIGPISAQGIDEWCAYYGKTVTPRWGWLGGVRLG